MIRRPRVHRCVPAFALLVGWACLPSVQASARDIVEILQDNGLITREEYKEANSTNTKPFMTYKEGLGFVFATPDKRFSLAVGGYIQVKYTLTDIDNRYQNPSKGTGDNQSFDVPRARVWWRGNAFSTRVFYKLE